jgi:hypothetical protein
MGIGNGNGCPRKSRRVEANGRGTMLHSCTRRNGNRKGNMTVFLLGLGNGTRKGKDSSGVPVKVGKRTRKGAVAVPL